MLRREQRGGNYSSCLMTPHAATYLPSRRETWFAFVRAVRAFDTDISPDLLPFNPIFSRISPRERPLPSRITARSCSRLLPLRARGARLPVCRVATGLPLLAAS